ncbi:MAG TPA: NADH-quinone oxidoreductase subunit M, partial [Acidobacteriaceae bacterium]|nr:NADH-quinone oxidoreductase subunit M [Acidobacteriaceae bacterium]
AARLTAATFATVAVAYTGWLWWHFQPAMTSLQFEEVHALEPSIGLSYHVGLDGLSLLMLAVSSITVLMAVAASWSNPKHSPAYFAFLLFLETGLFGTYTALNFLHWFLYWELSLIPAFFLIRMWGGPGRARAATQFFLYTMVGSITLLLAFLAIFLASGSFDFLELTRMAQNGQLAAAIGQNLHWRQWDSGHITMYLFCGAFLGFAVKTPIVPFHGWLASAYSEAAPETTMVLTGALSKMGVYGFLRILLPIFPVQMWRIHTILLWLAIATIVLPAFTAWAQSDLKRMFAYGSINHLGYCILGIVAVAGASGTAESQASEKAAALTGVMLQLFSHAITAAALFWFLALLERRSGGLTGLNDFGGLRRAMPVFSGLMGITLFASLGLPGLIGFPGEFLIFKGVFPLDWWAAALSLFGLLMTAVFLLTIVQRVFSGELHDRWKRMPDLSVAEQCVLAPVIFLLFALGLYPQVMSGMVHGTVTQLVGLVRY